MGLYQTIRDAKLLYISIVGFILNFIIFSALSVMAPLHFKMGGDAFKPFNKDGMWWNLWGFFLLFLYARVFFIIQAYEVGVPKIFIDPEYPRNYLVTTWNMFTTFTWKVEFPKFWLWHYSQILPILGFIHAAVAEIFELLKTPIKNPRNYGESIFFSWLKGFKIGVRTTDFFLVAIVEGITLLSVAAALYYKAPGYQVPAIFITIGTTSLLILAEMRREYRRSIKKDRNEGETLGDTLREYSNTRG